MDENEIPKLSFGGTLVNVGGDGSADVGLTTDSDGQVYVAIEDFFGEQSPSARWQKHG